MPFAVYTGDLFDNILPHYSQSHLTVAYIRLIKSEITCVRVACVGVYRDNGWQRIYIRQQLVVSREVDRVARYNYWSGRNSTIPADQRAHND